MDKDTIAEKYKHKYTENANEENIINVTKYKKENNDVINNKKWIKKRNDIIRLMKNKKIFNKENKNNLIFIFILFIILFKFVISNKNIRKLIFVNRITMIVEGNGRSRAILGQMIPIPTEVQINGVVQETLTNSYELENNNNTVILTWSEPLTSCANMFFRLTYILFVDLSEFDASQVTSMAGMFYSCTNLRSINIQNIDPRNVTDMENIFYLCQSLISLNFSNFRSISLRNMRGMFNGCTSLVSIDLSNFDTSAATNIDNLFLHAESLISLDLTSFNISSISKMKLLFEGCKSLVYINFRSFIENEQIELTDIFSEDNRNLIYCIDENKAPKMTNAFKEISLNNDCNNICFTGQKKMIIEKKICIDECSNDDTYILEKDNICYNPNATNEEDSTEVTENTVDNVKTDNNNISEITESIIQSQSSETEKILIYKFKIIF